MDEFTLLRDIASIRPGFHVRGRSSASPEGNLAVVQMSHIRPDRSIDYDTLVRLKTDIIYSDYFLNVGDVLITNRGYKNDGILVDRDTKETVAASHFYRIRLESLALLPEYLAWFINQPAAQRVLSRFKKNSSIPLLSREGVEALPVPIPPIDVQKKVAATGALLLREAQITDELKELRNKLVTAKLLQKVSAYQNGV